MPVRCTAAHFFTITPGVETLVSLVELLVGIKPKSFCSVFLCVASITKAFSYSCL